MRVNGSAAAPHMPAGSTQQGASGPLAAPSASAPQAISSGTNYQPGTLKSQVSAVLARFGQNTAAGPAASPTASAPRNAPKSAAPRLPACVPHLTGGQRPLLIDQARYQGHPATVIVFPISSGTLQVLVVATGCTATTSHVLAAATLPGPG